jgi:HAD superfamily hydrolase (TIGR01549 family)
MNPLLEAVAFDLDSTLCEYTLTVAEVTARAIERAGLADILTAPEELASAYNVAWWTEEQVSRVPTDELRRLSWRRVLTERGFDDPTIAERLAKAYSELRAETGLRLIAGVTELLEDLGSRYALGILTNGPSDMQWEKLRGLGLTERVDGIVVAGDRGIFKPDPRPFRELLEMLCAVPAASLFVGNSFEYDVLGAHAAGMRTAWIRSDGGLPTADVRPDHTIRVVTDLREILL